MKKYEIMRTPKRRLRQKEMRCFAKRFSGEQRALPQRFVRALRAVCKMRAAGKKVRGKSVGFSEERTPLGERARRASEPARAERATARKVSRLVYIGVRSELIYQNLHNFSVNINKINGVHNSAQKIQITGGYRTKVTNNDLKKVLRGIQLIPNEPQREEVTRIVLKAAAESITFETL